MNNQPRSDSEQPSQQQVDQTIELLESLDESQLPRALNVDQQSTIDVASAARASVAAHLPAPNQALRQQLIQATANSATSDHQAVNSTQSKIPLRRWVTAATVAVGLGISGWFLSGFNADDFEPSQVALQEVPTETEISEYAPAKPEAIKVENEEPGSISGSVDASIPTNSLLDDLLDESDQSAGESRDRKASLLGLPNSAASGTKDSGRPYEDTLRRLKSTLAKKHTSVEGKPQVERGPMARSKRGAAQLNARLDNSPSDKKSVNGREELPPTTASGEFDLGGGGRSLELYRPIYENSFTGATGSDAVSTFSIDVDTASYANTRRFLNQGQLPPPDAVRIEELINYFSYNYAPPTGADPFSVNIEMADCPWQPKHKLVRIGIKGKEVAAAEREATHLVFLLDVSGSMNSADKLPLLKRGFKMMVDQLNENDCVTIVTYAGKAGLALETTSGDQKPKINQAIDVLTSGGSTHGSAGIELAYQMAQQNFITGGNNKVILATDGDLNVGITQDKPLVELIKQKAGEGVFLTVLSFGTGNLKDGKMEQLADNGNGMYCYIDSVPEAQKVLVQQMSGTLVTIAKDVKIQVEFNPQEVHSYRLIGYENRLLAAADFDNDRKDAGEIGAGHTVTAIYEIVTWNQADAASVSSMALKYQTNTAPKKSESPVKTVTELTDAAASGELLTLAMRHKQPDSNTSKGIEFTIANQAKRFDQASQDFRFSASVAAYGMLLRRSEHAGNATAAMVEDIAAGSMGTDAQGYRAEFIDLVRKAKTLLAR